MKSIKQFTETQKLVKDILLFDSSRNKLNTASKKLIPRKALNRLQVYKELIWNNFNDVLKSIYPACFTLTGKSWSKLIRKYIKVYPPKSPLLNKVAERFPDFLQKQSILLQKYPFIAELALYEWLEVEIYERDTKVTEQDGILINPIHEICRFQYPVPQIVKIIKSGKTKLRKAVKQPTNIFIYRDPKTLTVRFFELEPGALAYIKLLKRGLREDLIIQKLAGMFNSHNLNHKKTVDSITKLKNVLKKNRIKSQVVSDIK